MFSHQLLLPLDAPPDDGEQANGTSEAEFKRRLIELSRDRIAEITLTRNRSTILSAKPLKGAQPRGLGGLPKQLSVRIHRCFISAPEPVLQAAADFTSKRLTKLKRREALDVLRDFFDQRAPKTEATKRKPRPLRGPKGKHHDLEAVFNTINRDYFDSELELTISWGTPPARRSKRRRTIQLGSFHDETQTVRIHPVLDHATVPDYVVGSVVHHEMVHAVVPAERTPGSRRRRIHTAAFRRKEQEYRELERAEAWLGRHLFRLMGRLERKMAKQRPVR